MAYSIYLIFVFNFFAFKIILHLRCDTSLQTSSPFPVPTLLDPTFINLRTSFCANQCISENNTTYA